MNDIPLSILFGILLLLIALSGFFSSSETGMMSLNRYRLKHLRNEGHRGARRASKLLERPDSLISVILIGNNLVNILASAIATVIAMRLYGDAGIAVATILLTLVILIFAEVTPKTMAALHPEGVAFPASIVLQFLLKLLYPVVFLINKITGLLLKLANVDHKQSRGDQLNPDELRTVVNEAGMLIPHHHQGMLLNILDLEKISVKDIMIPRNEIYAIDLDDEDEEILDKIQKSEFTRLLVYEEDIDNVIGILHLRQTSSFITPTGLDREALRKVISEPYFIPEGTGLNIQLLNFQKDKLRFGIVVDEYGVIQGIATLEDILEEIVGEFTSNLNAEDDEIVAEDDGSYLVDGTTTIREINRNLDWSLPTDGPKTLNGLIVEHLESFPDANAGIRLGDYYAEIIEIKDNVIQTARLFTAKKAKTAHKTA